MGTARDFHVKTGLTVDSGNVTLSNGNLLVNSGHVDIDSIKIDGQTISTVTGNEDINITPHGSGSVVMAKVDINAGTIDGATIATSDITVGSSKTLDVSAGTLTLANDQISGDKVSGGTIGTTTITALAGDLSLGDNNITNVGDINADSISVDAAASGLNIDMSGANTGTAKITLNDGIADALSITDGSADFMVFNTTAETITFGKNSTFNGTTIADLGTVTTANIDGGSIDDTTIGGGTPAAGTFLALQGTNGLFTGHGRVGGTARETNSRLQVNGPALSGSAAATSQNYAEARIHTDVANDDVAGTTYNGMGNALVLDNAENVHVGQVVAFTQGRSGTGNSWTIGRQGNRGGSGSNVFQIGHIDKDYDNKIGSADSSVEAAQYKMQLDTSGNLKVLGDITLDDGGSLKEAGGTAALTFNASGEITALNIPAAAVAQASDHIIFMDGGATGAPKVESISDFLTAIAGSGISVSSSQLVADGGGTATALAADNLTAGDAAVLLTTTTGNITIDAQAGDSDIIFKGTDGSSDTTFLTLDGSEEGKAIFNADVTVGDDLTLLSDASVLGFGANTDVTLTHVHDTGLLLNAAMQLQFRDSGLKVHSTANGQLDIDSDATIDIVGPVTNITATTGAGIASPSIIFSDTASGKPVVEIKNTTNDTSSAELKFVKDKGAAGADGDDVGKITFVGDDAAQAQTSFGQILVEVSEADNSDEAGKMSLLVAESDGTDTALTAGLVLEGQHATDGVVDVTIGAGSGSVTTIAGNLTVNGTTTTISSTTLEVTDDLITVSKGNDSIANADGSGMEIDATGATNIHWKYVHARTALQSNVDIDLATTSETLKIAGTDVLSNNTLGTGVVTSSLTTVGALTSGFGNINNGSSTITTTGLISGGSLDIDDVLINGTTIGHTDDTDLITLADGLVTVAGEISVTTLDIGGTNVSSTAAELNLVDGSSAGTVVNSKAVIYSSAGEVKASTVSVDAVAVLDTSSEDGRTVANSAAHAAVTYADGTYRTAKFVYQISDGTDFESGEILVNYKGASAPSDSDDIFLTQYAIVSTKASNAALVTWDAVLNSGNIELRFTNSTGGSVDYDYRVVNTLLIK